MKCKVKSPEGGFTLVEIIASIVLLGVVISVFLSIFPQMISWSNAAEKELVSSNYSARVAHEIYKGENFDFEEVYKKFPEAGTECALDLSNYEKVKVKGQEKYENEKTIGGIEYVVKMEACLDKEEGDKHEKVNLMRVHFTITNDKNNFKMSSFAFFDRSEVTND